MNEKWSPVSWFVFDVESVGLHGEGFQVAWVVVDASTDAMLEEGKIICGPNEARGNTAGRQWVSDNVPDYINMWPADEDSDVLTVRGALNSPRAVREMFWTHWLGWKGKGAVMAADCPWPVEARFLAACVDEDPAAREWEGPYPLIDVGSVLAARGIDPLADHDRLEDEPKHCPLGDARQSARLLLQALRASESS